MSGAASYRLFKVDGVASVGEASALQAAGANVIGITLAGGGAPDAPRTVSQAMALAIREALTGAQLCVTLDESPDDAARALEPALALSADMIQLVPHGVARASWREPVEAAGLQVVLDGEEISYEDDPAFIEQRFGHARNWAAPLFQVSLLDDINAPWTHLTTKAAAQPVDYIQLDDIRRATEQYEMLISMEASPAEAKALLASLPACRGYFVRLGTDGTTPVLDLLGAIAG